MKNNKKYFETGKYSEDEVCCGTVTDHTRRGTILTLNDGSTALMPAPKMPVGTRVICTVLKRASGRRCAEVKFLNTVRVRTTCAGHGFYEERGW